MRKRSQQPARARGTRCPRPRTTRTTTTTTASCWTWIFRCRTRSTSRGAAGHPSRPGRRGSLEPASATRRTCTRCPSRRRGATRWPPPRESWAWTCDGDWRDAAWAREARPAAAATSRGDPRSRPSGGAPPLPPPPRRRADPRVRRPAPAGTCGCPNRTSHDRGAPTAASCASRRTVSDRGPIRAVDSTPASTATDIGSRRCTCPRLFLGARPKVRLRSHDLHLLCLEARSSLCSSTSWGWFRAEFLARLPFFCSSFSGGGGGGVYVFCSCSHFDDGPPSARVQSRVSILDIVAVVGSFVSSLFFFFSCGDTVCRLERGREGETETEMYRSGHFRRDRPGQRIRGIGTVVSCSSLARLLRYPRAPCDLIDQSCSLSPCLHRARVRDCVRIFVRVRVFVRVRDSFRIDSTKQ